MPLAQNKIEREQEGGVAPEGGVLGFGTTFGLWGRPRCVTQSFCVRVWFASSELGFTV